MEWYEELREKMREYDVSRKSLAGLCGLDYANLAKILKGHRSCSLKMQSRLLEAVERFNPKYKMDALYDYVRIRFPTQDYEEVMCNVLEMKPEYFIKEDHAFYGYKTLYSFAEIAVFVSREEDKQRGTLIELKGKGCRKYEYILKAQSRTWNDFFVAAQYYGGVFKRVDIAINDIAGILDIPEMSRKIQQDEYRSVFRKFSPMANIQEVGEQQQPICTSDEAEIYEYKNVTGNTLYIGSRKSEVYFCVYEKDAEQFIREGVPLEQAEVKNRFELRLKNERAQNAINAILEGVNFESIAFGIIERYFTLLDRGDTEDKKEWPANFRWRWFMGDGRAPVRLTAAPEPPSIEKTLRWLAQQVAASWKLGKLCDEIAHTNYMEQLENIQLPRKQQKLLQQIAPDITEVIFLHGIDKKGIQPQKPVCKTDEELSAALQLRKQKAYTQQVEQHMEELQNRLRAYERIMAIRQISTDDIFL